MTRRLRRGDLVLLSIVEHEADPKRFAIMGRFKGSKAQHILARIGEGTSDVRPPELIRLTAEGVAREIRSLYATMAHARDIAEREGSAILLTQPPEERTSS